MSESDGGRFSDNRRVVQTGGEVKPIFSCNTVLKENLKALELKVLF